MERPRYTHVTRRRNPVPCRVHFRAFQGFSRSIGVTLYISGGLGGILLKPRNAYRLRLAAAFIAKAVRQNPDLVAFPVLKTRDPEIRARRRAEIVAIAGNATRATSPPPGGWAA